MLECPASARKLRRAYVLALFLALAPAAAFAASAQEDPSRPGGVSGIVRDAETGSALQGASVGVARTTDTFTITGADGSYRFTDLPSGKIDLVVALRGYVSQKVPVEIRPGEMTTLDLLLPPDSAGSLSETVEITGRRLKADPASALLERSRASGSVERVTTVEIGKTTASDAGAVVQRVPAVSVVDGKFAFVRGLGDRYSQTLFNNAILPSPEPDKRVVPLDLFPASLLESLTVVKTYSPDLPGEFAGGSVQIETIDVPEEGFFKISTGVKYRADTTLQKFRSYQGGRYDIFAYDDGTREIPSSVPSQPVAAGNSGQGLSDAQVQAIGRSFENIWDPHFDTAGFDHKVGVTFGDRFDTGGTSALGVIGALNWGNNYVTVDDYKYRVLKNQGTLAAPDPFVFNSFRLTSSTFSAETSGLLNATYQFDSFNKIGIRNFITRSADDFVRLQEGRDGQQDRDIKVTQLRYVERMLYNGQLFGEQLLAFDHFLRWRYSYSISERDEPDDRQVRYDVAPATGIFSYEDVGGSGAREFYFLSETVDDASLDYAIPFNPFGVEVPAADPDSPLPDQKLQVGASLSTRDREFDTRRFRFIPSSVAGLPQDENGNPIDLSASPEEVFRARNINPLGFVLTEVTRPTDNYEATQDLGAVYGFADFRVFEPIRIQGGARIERSDQEVTTFELFGNPPATVRADLTETDILPAANLTLELTPRVKLRLGASQTVSRPEFRELAEFQFTDVAGGFSARGNPALERAQITNYDVRAEWYPTAGEIISVSGFVKEFKDPIEVVIIPTGSALISTWENSDQGELYGVELEIRKNLGSFASALENLSLKTNFALIESEVKTNPGSAFVQTNDKRPLQGQPEYTLNLGLFYDSENFESGIELGTFGERLSAVGAFGVPDEIEQPRISLDCSLSFKMGPGKLRFSAENILDDDYQYKQGAFTTRQYKLGVVVGVSYSYSF